MTPKEKAGELAIEFFRAGDESIPGIGPLGIACIKAASYVKGIINNSKNESEISYYKEVFHILNCPYKPFRIELDSDS